MVVRLLKPQRKGADGREMSRRGENRRGRFGFGVAALVFIVLLLTTAGSGLSGATDSGWNIITSPNTAPSETNLLMGTTCTSAWSCVAVGGEFSSLGNNSQPVALIDTWNGSRWSLGPDVTPPGSQASLLWGVACVTSSDCWAVGAQEPSNQQSPVTLAEHWNGSAWSVVPTPADSGYLFSVTCSSTSECWAVGASLDSQKNPLNGIIYHWNGAQWSEASRASSGQPFDEFDSVTCTDSSDCWAVGYAGPNQIQYNFLPGVAPTLTGGAALVEHWNGIRLDDRSDPRGVCPSRSGADGGHLHGIVQLLGGGHHHGRQRKSFLFAGGPLERIDMEHYPQSRSVHASQHPHYRHVS